MKKKGKRIFSVQFHLVGTWLKYSIRIELLAEFLTEFKTESVLARRTPEFLRQIKQRSNVDKKKQMER